MQLAQGKNSTCFIYFDIPNLTNFAVVKSLRKFGDCLGDNNSFFFYNVINNLEPDPKIIFETLLNLSKSLNFLDINFQIDENNLAFDIYYKSTNSFNYLTLHKLPSNTHKEQYIALISKTYC